MIYEREEFGEQILFKGTWYDCEYPLVKLERDSIQGSETGLIWHRLKGTDALGFNNESKPIEEKVKDFDPINYARQ